MDLVAYLQIELFDIGFYYFYFSFCATCIIF